MDRFLTLFGPLVWPLATLIIALIFRRDVSLALGRVGQVKYRDLELTFRDDLHQAEQLARSIPPPAARPSTLLEVAPDEAKPLVGRLIVAPSTSDEPGDRPDLSAELAARPPREAVEAAWGVVTQALARASRVEGDRRNPPPTNPEVAARMLVDRGRLARSEALLIGLLRTLRDRAARLDRSAPSTEDASRYVNLALRVASRIEDLG